MTGVFRFSRTKVVQQSQEALQVQAEETAKSSAEGLQKEVEQLWERNRALEEELSKLDKSVEEGLKGVESRNEERILQLQETQLKQSEDLTNFKDSFATKTEEELNKIAEVVVGPGCAVGCALLDVLSQSLSLLVRGITGTSQQCGVQHNQFGRTAADFAIQCGSCESGQHQ